MAKEEPTKIRGKIIEVLPNTLFRVKLDGMDLVILGYISGKIRQNEVKLLLGDVVDVEIGRYDPKRGRIVYRYK